MVNEDEKSIGRVGVVLYDCRRCVWQRARAEGEIPARPAIGSTIGDFTLPDSDNKEHSLKSLAGKNGTVLLFVSVQCPVSNAYNERMEKLAQDYKAKGINVIGINSNVAKDAASSPTRLTTSSVSPS